MEVGAIAIRLHARDGSVWLSQADKRMAGQA